MPMKKIARIRSGGQSGVDRAALDIARTYGIPITGWCPKDGWAEDYPEKPGLLAVYPELMETPSKETEQRTIWNVRDSHATLIIDPWKADQSIGTDLTIDTAKAYGRPVLIVTSGKSAPEVIEWLDTLPNELTLNVAGPRASECDEAYKKTIKIMQAVLDTVNC